VPLQKPENLLTVDPGLATAPPEQLQMQTPPPVSESQTNEPESQSSA